MVEPVHLATTLSLYVARVFCFFVLAMLAALTAVVALFDLIELLRRSAMRPEATFGVVVEIAALRLPWAAMQILPFAVLLGGILAFWRLTRSSELIVARAAGISAWQFLAAPTLCAIALGAFATTVVSPISAAMRARAEAIDSAFIKVGGGPLALNGGQLWMRQADNGLTPQGVALLHAGRVNVKGGELIASAVSVFRLDASDRLLERIDATGATLLNGDWVLSGARTLTPGHPAGPGATMHLPTNMTVARVQDSFAPPDTLSFWALPGFIDLLDRSGFSSIRHRLQFQSLLALPLLAGTMALLAAGFSMRPARRGGVAQMIGSGVAAGFALFVVSKVAEEFGQTGALPPVLAAWAPAASGLMLAVALLLHLEDG
jgi:lipopolysaccharide export system permease protein